MIDQALLIFLLIQATAILPSILDNAGPLFKNERTMLLIGIPADLLWAGHFLLLDGMAGAVICILAAIRTTICLFLPKGTHAITVYVYIGAIIAAAFFSIGHWIDSLPLIAGIVASFSLLHQDKGKLIRILFMISAILWTVYELYIGAYLTAFTTILYLVACVVGWVRKYGMPVLARPSYMAAE